ncbi:hypothetical protein [Micromonospora sp. NPDC023633]|uniref:hypothetical protein n=1 Tax=Micromonospora sp. NPDC023633 TaxID=3154320 RepID=UPI0033D30226
MELFRGMATAAIPGGVGAGVLAALWHEQVRFQKSCESDTIGACLGFAFPALVVGPVVVVAAVWLLLRATEVGRPAPAALLGAAFTGGALRLALAARPFSVPPPVWLVVLLAVAGFAAGVAVVVARLPLVGRGVLALVLLLPWFVAPLVGKESRRDALREGFAQVGLPLVVPQVEGYQVTSARAFVDRRLLSITMDRGGGWVSVYVVPLPADFAPPGSCGPTRADISRRAGREPSVPQPCRAVGADHWVRTEEGEEVHLVRREGGLVLLSPGGEASSADAAAGATNLTAVTPGQLAELAVR